MNISDDFSRDFNELRVLIRAWSTPSTPYTLPKASPDVSRLPYLARFATGIRQAQGS